MPIKKVKKKTAKKKKLTVKQRKFVKEYAKDGNGTRAAKAAGYSPNSAHAIASENLNKPEIKEGVRKIYERAGITNELLAEQHAKILKAKKIVILNKNKHKTVDDYAIQLRAIEIAHQLLGNFKQENKDDNYIERIGRQFGIPDVDFETKSKIESKEVVLDDGVDSIQ